MSEFKDKDGLGLRLPKSIVKFIQIPTQMLDEKEIENVENTASVNSELLATIVIGSLFLNWLIEGKVTQIWDLFEALQIV